MAPECFTGTCAQSYCNVGSSPSMFLWYICSHMLHCWVFSLETSSESTTLTLSIKQLILCKMQFLNLFS